VSRGRSFALRIGAAIVGALLGGGLIVALGGGNDDPPDPPQAQPAPPSPRFSTRPVEDAGSPSAEISRRSPSRRLLLAWSPGGLPATTERSVERLAGVKRATTVLAQLEWIESSRAPGVGVVDKPRAGLAIPFEVAAVEPREYAHFIPREDRRNLLALEPGRMLLAQTAAQLRGAGRGLSIRTDTSRRLVSGVVEDTTTNGYEALTAAPAPALWSDSYRFVLAELETASAGARVRGQIAGLLAGQPLQIRTGGENPFLRYGDAVLPQMLVKEAFGEFAARPMADGSIEIDPMWRRSHIVKTNLPLVGQATCHRDLLPQLVSALRELRDKGLDHLIHPEQFEGCFSPRFISHNPQGNLSHHAWGMAVDLNADENAFGHRPSMDDRIVSVFEKWGFTWGGEWIVPDGMHFEWIQPP
jgi:hypothetical protein